MKQVFQDFKSGIPSIHIMPEPNINKNQVLVKSICSLISPGTEAMLASFGKANLINKALQQPDKVKEVIDKISSDGLLDTFEAVRSKIDDPIPLGYSNFGQIIKVGENVKGLKIGDRVASNGPHAEVFAVNQNLCAIVPEGVSEEDAAFTVLASIGLQGIRLAKPSYGETFIVIGLGLIGQLTSQLLIAQGCKVLGVDPDGDRCKLAESFGVTSLNISNGFNQVDWAIKNSDNIGVDGAIITAATDSSEPINLAAKSCRKRGRIILVGATSINLRRDLFYEKELTFQVSCSYGPGRYDKNYEELSNDYPIGYVRWTEKRNFETIINSFKRNSLNINNLVSHRFDFESFNKAYEILLSKENSLGIIINYPQNNLDKEYSKIILDKNIYAKNQNNYQNNREPFIGFIGSGNYASRILIPTFNKLGANFHSLIAPNGLSSTQLAKKFSFPIVGTDSSELLNDQECNTIVIATRHDSHASFILKALEKRKNIFVEKPLCIKETEMELIKLKYRELSLSSDPLPILMVAFNRRFSPLVKDIKNNLNRLNGPKSFIYTCNAGEIDSRHWVQDPSIGGGRLLGEACHFVDLMRYLCSSSIENAEIISFEGKNPTPDNFILHLKFKDGSIGSINYFSNGSKSFPKERLEIFCNGTIQRLDNFRKLKTWGFNVAKNRRLYKQDKGQINCVKEFINAIKRGQNSPIDFHEILEVQHWLFKLSKDLQIKN